MSNFPIRELTAAATLDTGTKVGYPVNAQVIRAHRAVRIAKPTAQCPSWTTSLLGDRAR